MPNTELINNKANEIALSVASSRNTAIDPSTILTIIKIIIELVKIIKECKNQEQTISNPGVLSRWRLRRIIKNAVQDKSLRDDMYRAILKSGTNLKNDELKQLVS